MATIEISKQLISRQKKTELTFEHFHFCRRRVKLFFFSTDSEVVKNNGFLRITSAQAGWLQLRSKTNNKILE